MNSLLVALQNVALASCWLFAGAAVYINAVEHPARMGCGTALAATVWKPSYQRAYVMQATLAATSVVTGIGAWWFSEYIGWLVGALLIGAVIPFTFIVIMPTNQRLFEPARDLASAETNALLIKWGHLHAVRSALSVCAALVFLAALQS